MRLTSRLLLRQYLFWLVSLNTMRLSTIVWKSLCFVNYRIHHASFTETLARVGPTYWALLEERPLQGHSANCHLRTHFFPDTRDQRSLLIQLFSKYSRCMRDFFPFLAYISHGRIAFACIRSSRILPYSADWLQRQDICLQLWFLS